MVQELSDADIKWFASLWVTSITDGFERMKIGIDPDLLLGHQHDPISTGR
jgi:hypothetical protein